MSVSAHWLSSAQIDWLIFSWYVHPHHCHHHLLSILHSFSIFHTFISGMHLFHTCIKTIATGYSYSGDRHLYEIVSNKKMKSFPHYYIVHLKCHVNCIIGSCSIQLSSCYTVLHRRRFCQQRLSGQNQHRAWARVLVVEQSTVCQRLR